MSDVRVALFHYTGTSQEIRQCYGKSYAQNTQNKEEMLIKYIHTSSGVPS